MLECDNPLRILSLSHQCETVSVRFSPWLIKTLFRRGPSPFQRFLVPCRSECSNPLHVLSLSLPCETVPVSISLWWVSTLLRRGTPAFKRFLVPCRAECARPLHFLFLPLFRETSRKFRPYMSYYFPFPSLSVNLPHFRRARCSAPESYASGYFFLPSLLLGRNFHPSLRLPLKDHLLTWGLHPSDCCYLLVLPLFFGWGSLTLYRVYS